MINGRDLILSLNGTAVAASKGCSLKVNQNYIKSCSPTDGRTKRNIPTDYDWRVSTDCLVADTAYADSIIDLLTQGTEVTIRWYDTELHQKRKGQAIIASIDENAPVNSLSTMSINLEGSGPLDKFSEDTVSLTDATIYNNKRLHSVIRPGFGTIVSIGNYSGMDLYAKSIIVSTSCKIKLVKTSGIGHIIAANEATTQTLVNNNSEITNLIGATASANPSYITLPAGSYTFIGNTDTGITWKIIGQWQYE